MLKVRWSTKFLILAFMFLKYAILWVYPWCDFCGTNFFIFQGIVWLVKSSWCVHCCSIHQFYCVSDCCWCEFGLWWFFVRKKIVVTVLAVFLSFCSWLSVITWVFKNLKKWAAFLWSIMHCLLVIGTWECLIFDFSFYSVESWLLCVYQWCGFSRYKFFHFWSQCLADMIILIWSFFKLLQFDWGSGCCTSEYALDCSCLNKVVTNWSFPLASGLGYWMFLQFWHLWIRQRPFLALQVCWRLKRVLGFWFWSL